MESETDISAQRRMIFAAAFLLQDIPHYWKITADFANQGPGVSKLTKDSVKLVVENLQILKADVFTADVSLTNQLL